MNIIEILKKSEEDLKSYLKDYLCKKGYKDRIINTKDYLFAIGKIPVLLVAHLDTVHKDLPKTIVCDKEKGLLWSPEGIGGDDRCGVYAIMKLIESNQPYILFTTQEEVGGIGARAFIKNILVDLKKYFGFIIEIDRRGSDDAVFYDCGNEDFKKYILDFGFKEEWGTFSDISVISPVYDIASVNLSSGYYNEHQKIEYINLNELNQTIKKIDKILKDKENHKYFDYQEIKHYYDFSKNNNSKKEKVKDEELDFVPNENIEDYYSLLKSDYENLDDKEFFRYYGIEKPKTLQELLDYMGM